MEKERKSRQDLKREIRRLKADYDYSKDRAEYYSKEHLNEVCKNVNLVFAVVVLSVLLVLSISLHYT
jgi:hypothetical protein